MPENIRSHKDLRVYQEALDAAMEVFELTKSFPKQEQYSLTDQIRRSSRSVCANIGEAWRRRRYPAHFVSKLNDSEGEAAETLVHIEISLRCQYITREQSASLEDRYDKVLGQLVKMSAHPEQWTIR
jgi:four helix bundle protein